MWNSNSRKHKKWKNDDFMKLSSLCNKESRFAKEQEASELLSSFGWKKGLDKIPVIAPIFFKGIKSMDWKFYQLGRNLCFRYI